MLNHIIKFFIENKLVAWLLLLFFIGWGVITSPFDLGVSALPRNPVLVDAIPNLGENQQIIFTEWKGRSPQDIEDQITYPLTSYLLGTAGVKSIRSNSMFGFSSIYVIFEENVDFYWSRSRLLEKLNALPSHVLPEEVKPTLGPDATALGQIFWYTLEGRDPKGQSTGGWDLHEIRSIQDFYVRPGLTAAKGVAEVASIGGFVQEYQVDVRPDQMRVYGITLPEVMQALKESNVEVGAQTLEINLVEYFIRGLGSVKSIEAIENTVVTVRQQVPIRIKDIAQVYLGPAARRGLLDKAGAAVVGGVVVSRYGANPMAVVQDVKTKIAEIAPGLPSKTLADGTPSKITIVPFYDRTQLISQTLGTLKEALHLEILITIMVVLLLLLNLRSSLLVAGVLPVAVLMCFIAMRYAAVEANIMALSGIVIAVGTMVDMGIVLTENMLTHLKKAPPKQPLTTIIINATKEVAPAVITALATTVVSFLPVFTMVGAEGKLFRPLAFTKTFALIASVVVAITLLPPLAVQFFGFQSKAERKHLGYSLALLFFSGALAFYDFPSLAFVGLVVGLISLVGFLLKIFKKGTFYPLFKKTKHYLYSLIIAWLLSKIWMPLGVEYSLFINFLFVALLVGLLIGYVTLIIRYYERILRFVLKIKYLFLAIIALLLFCGVQIARNMGQEFMPSLDEGTFLLMPTTMPHAGVEVNLKNLRTLDMAVNTIPEVELVVGKAGRVESALDPAPLSMYENLIQYKSEYITDKNGKRLRFKKGEKGHFLLAKGGSLSPEEALKKGLAAIDLVEDPNGSYFRQWRSHIHSSNDIWKEITAQTQLPGLTSAPKLQPIQTRLIMLQSGMRAPMGIKIKGPDLTTIEKFGLTLEKQLKLIEGINPTSVYAERMVSKPYLLLELQREKISRYGLSIAQVQAQLQAAIGGMKLSTTIEGRERYAIRLRYPREWLSHPEKLQDILVAAPGGIQVPLGDLVKLHYEQGPQAIKSEDGFLVGYVLFDKKETATEVDVVERAQKHLTRQIESGQLIVPQGVSYTFAGNYEQQQRANNTLRLVLPLALALIFLILYFQFRSITISLMVFLGVFVAFSGGFILLWLYGQSWFMNVDLFDLSLRSLFQIQPINLSVAVWVGFLALFGIATDDGVLVSTFLRDSFKRNKPQSKKAIEEAVIEGGLRRVRPAMMTTTTTLLALMPVLTATGRGADLMLPMALPTFGGMALQVLTLFTVPVLFSIWKEYQLKIQNR